MTTLQILLAAKARIATPELWCQRDMRRDGRSCACAALIDANIELGGENIVQALNVVGISASQLFDFNDTHTHPEVIALLDRAIAAEQAKVQS